jgi:hypothetical protein
VKFWFVWALVLCTAASAADVTPRIADIQIFGNRKIATQKIQKAIGAKAGDLLPPRAEMEKHIDKIHGIVASRVEAVCCEEGNLMLYVGVQEKGAPDFELRLPPSGTEKLPGDLIKLYNSLLENVAASIRGQNADQDLTNGYSLMADPDSRMIQLKMIPLVARDLKILDQVVRHSADPGQRAAAAYLLQYGPRDPQNSKIMVNALQYALRDSNDDVRANAVRALHAVMVGAKLHPEQHIPIQPTWYVQLMQSIDWSDRRRASLALVDMTDKDDTATLELIRERALRSVINMAGWHNLTYALPAFILAGRIAGLSKKQIDAAWVSGNLKPVLEKARQSKRKHAARL